MKALDVYFLMVVFMLFLNVVHDFANLVFNLDRETCDSERVMFLGLKSTDIRKLSQWPNVPTLGCDYQN